MLPWAELLEGRLALNLGSFFLCSKAFSGIILIILFWASNHLTCRQKELKLKCFLSFQNLNSNLALNLGYLNPALNNLALGARGFLSVVCSANWTAKWQSRSRLRCSIFAANNKEKKPLAPRVMSCLLWMTFTNISRCSWRFWQKYPINHKTVRKCLPKWGSTSCV